MPRPLREDALSLEPLARVLGDVSDLKRMHNAKRPGSIATQLFEAGWAAYARGADLTETALVTTAQALVATSLGGVDASVLRDAGLDREAVQEILGRGFDALALPLEPRLASALRLRLGQELGAGEPPAFVGLLARQPRAGATRPGKARLILEPTENHAEHSLLVAVNGVLLAPRYDADPAQVFLAGMSHHLHNAYLPDGGFAGEARLGAQLGAIVDAFRARALAEIGGPLAENALRLARETAVADSATARAFHAADVIDRVLQQRWHARAAGFTLDYALSEMEIVHPGPIQAFHAVVLAEAGLG